MEDMPNLIQGIPVLSGWEERVRNVAGSGQGAFSETDADFDSINSAFAIALHMHQPLIPGGGDDIKTAKVIGNLQHMMEHPDIGDNHNASTFRWCYKRLAEFIPQLLEEGNSPRVMLDYSGCLLYGFQQTGDDEVLEALKYLATDPACRNRAEWLGSAWGHPVAPSTPVQDYRLHVSAWQHHFASLFGEEALSRVTGFSPSEMALPNHPDLAYEFINTLVEAGYKWIMLQEHTVETTDGQGVCQPHVPHRLVATNSKGETASIIAVIKTQGSDTKLVAQMQPYYEACGLQRTELAGKSVPPIVSQVADGENGGVMMNEFPDKYFEGVRNASGSNTRLVNVSEYLQYLQKLGISKGDLPSVQPVMQNKIWENFKPGDGPDKLAKVIKKLKEKDDQFHTEGGSWTNDISWVQGYDDVLGPMERVSAKFAEKVLKSDVDTSEFRYNNALFYLLMSQTSCYRYWGEGVWTEYGKELCRRASDIIEHDF